MLRQVMTSWKQRDCNYLDDDGDVKNGEDNNGDGNNDDDDDGKDGDEVEGKGERQLLAGINQD